MVRRLETPLQSPRRRNRFKPTPLDPVIVEEESDLLSPVRKDAKKKADAAENLNGVDSDVDVKSKDVSDTGFQVTAV